MNDKSIVVKVLDSKEIINSLKFCMEVFAIILLVNHIIEDNHRLLFFIPFIHHCNPYSINIIVKNNQFHIYDRPCS